ncbi:hypothetical protein MMC27_007623 [Xylographa pallens]|nr:hypothetical protein [Xylographa pallens]
MGSRDGQALVFFGNQGYKWTRMKNLTTIIRLDFMDKVIVEKQLLEDVFISISKEENWAQTFWGPQRDSNGIIIFIYWSCHELPSMFNFPAIGLLPPTCPLLPLLPFICHPPQIITSPLDRPISTTDIERHGGAYELELLSFPENKLLVEEWFQQLYQMLDFFLYSEDTIWGSQTHGDFIGSSRAWALDKVQTNNGSRRLNVILLHWASVEAEQRFKDPLVPNIYREWIIGEDDPAFYEKHYLKALLPLLDHGVQRENLRFNLSEWQPIVQIEEHVTNSRCCIIQ